MIILKCFGVCGCGFDNKCNYCNSSFFKGYDNQVSFNYLVINSSLSQIAPNSNALTCSLNTEDIDVNMFLL